MILEKAHYTDAQELSDFFKKFPLASPVEIRVDRQGLFFTPYEIQSPDYITYCLRDETTRELFGVATFVAQEIWLEGIPTRVIFARDLRISPVREAIIGWTKFFLPVFEEIRRELRAHHVFSIINRYELQALNAFVRPRARRRPMPSYHLYRRMYLVTLHGQFPWCNPALKTIRIVRGHEIAHDKWITYLTEKSIHRELGRNWNPKVFAENMKRWPGLDPMRFLVALDGEGKVVGCCAPWTSAGVEELIPVSYNLVSHNFRQFLKFGSLLGWTRKLTKPIHRLSSPGILDFDYLTHLYADNADIFAALLFKAYEKTRKSAFLVYAQTRSDLHLRKPPGWVGNEIPFGIYCMVPPGEDVPKFLHPANEDPIEIEPFFFV